MNIGQASKQSGISTKMIRYYEQIGLLETVSRSDSGYRLYCKDDIDDLCFLKHSRDLGFSSKQMKELLYLRKNANRQSADVKQLTQEHIETLNQKSLSCRTWLICYKALLIIVQAMIMQIAPF